MYLLQTHTNKHTLKKPTLFHNNVYKDMSLYTEMCNSRLKLHQYYFSCPLQHPALYANEIDEEDHQGDTEKYKERA